MLSLLFTSATPIQETVQRNRINLQVIVWIIWRVHMAMQTIYFKEHEAIVHNSIGQLSSATSAPWWTALGSQTVQQEPFAQMKPFSLDFPNYVDHLTSPKQPERTAHQVLDKGHTTQFTIFPEDCEMSDDTRKHQAVMSLHPSSPEPRGHFEIKFSQPIICSKYPYMDRFYGLISAYGPQIPGRLMLPLNLTPDDGPIYVNAKQYHGIIRRRQSRAKASLENKLTKRRRPYMHESRHLHAMRRPRGCGGRFLNTRNLKNGKGERGSTLMIKTGEGLLQSSGSQNSEVLQAEGGILNSSKETNGSSSYVSGLEVTSIYGRGTFESFGLSHVGPTVHSLASMIDSERGIAMPAKWIAAAGNNCCKL